MAFHVGQKVVCINDTHKAFNIPGRRYLPDSKTLIKKGEIYTIRAINIHRYGHVCMTLVELPDRVDNDAGYCVERFRPLVENKTDISVFTRLLNFPQVKIEKDQFDLVEM